MSTPAALLSCRGLCAQRGRREVIHSVGFAIGEGEVVALLGPNGAGKSTLLDVLGGVLTPTAGEVLRSGRVAVAMQSPDLANRTALANVTAALGWWGVPRPQRPARARAALEAMGAAHLADRPARTLSGGERRRVHLARTFAVAPDLLMLDEPFAGLDARIRGELLADTGAALRASARAALVVVHDRAEAWALADRLLILLEGRLVADGTPQALLTTPPTADVARFLGFDGELAEADGSVRLTRPQHVRLDPDGPLRARVQTLIPTEDGVRLVLALPVGHLGVNAELPGPRVGDEVRVRVDGGVRFAASQPGAGPDPTVAGAVEQSTRP